MNPPDSAGNRVIDAIGQRRAVREYSAQPVDDETLRTLLHAAVRAPTAMHREPWQFVVLRDRDTRAVVTARAKALLDASADQRHDPALAHLYAAFTAPGFDIFYGAPALIVIGSSERGEFVAADCWLAAENLMLAATSLGLGSCVIGLAVGALNDPQIRRAVGIPDDFVAIAPIIVGYPAAGTPAMATPRREPVVVTWR
ncbi:MAG: NAD(P)H nitroreductase [Rhodanobacteraceae bacterium]